MKDIIRRMKVNGHSLFSPDDLDDLLDDSFCSVRYFKQEDETDAEFYRHFAEWLAENRMEGYVNYYIVAGMRKHETLTDDEFRYLESRVADGFETGHGWIIESNNALRFKRRMTLITFRKRFPFRSLVRKMTV